MTLLTRTSRNPWVEPAETKQGLNHRDTETLRIKNSVTLCLSG